MSKGILKAAILVFPVLAAADTLIMKDGSSIRGTFNNANTRQMTFTEYNGNRRDVSLTEVQELRFGNDQQQQYSSSDRPASNDRNTGYPQFVP